MNLLVLFLARRNWAFNRIIGGSRKSLRCTAALRAQVTRPSAESEFQALSLRSERLKVSQKTAFWGKDGSVAMTARDFRRIALSLDGAEEGSHMGAVDFRVGGRVFATLASVKEGYGNLKLTPELQTEFIEGRPDLFLPIRGGWGRMGMTHVRLKDADEDSLRGALSSAWRLQGGANRKSGKPGKRG